ncbi:MAG: LCP family protein [Ruminococcus sp.]|nr:LCP family protein [Ruminococcus sp.]
MSKTKSKKTKLIYGALILLLAVLLVSSTLLLLSYWEKGRGLFPAHDVTGSAVNVDGVNYILNDDVQGILVLGLDKFDEARDDTGFYNDQQADFLMLFVVDNEKETFSAIHLNRDTMAEINVLGVAGEKIDTFTGQLALAHTYGNGREVSCRNTVDAVSGVLNDINIERINDDFSDIDDTLVMGETVTLNSTNVLNFVRTRQGLEDSSNTARMTRQQDYLTSLFKAFNEKAEEDESFIVDSALKLSDYIVSNYTVNQLENLIENLSTYEFKEIYSIDGESKAGEKFMEFYADQNDVNRLLLDLFYIPEN